MKKIVEVTRLSKSYEDFRLDDINFTLFEGCVTGFIGVNGAGKTTTIRTLLGLTEKDSGNVKIFNSDFDSNALDIKNRIGVVLDEGFFYEDLSIDKMKAILAPAYSNWNENTFHSYLDQFELNQKQKISTLSRGMKMKLALAFALSHQAELLIMDEPTSGLDPLVRTELMSMLTEFMKSDDRAVFFSTHITSDLEKIADYIIMIDDGKVVLQAEKDTLMDAHRIVKGDVDALTDDLRNAMRNLQVGDFGFSALTHNVAFIQKSVPNILVEKPSLEDIMLGYIGGRCR